MSINLETVHLKDKSKVCFFSGPRPQNLPSESFDPYQHANKRMLLALREVIIDHIDNKGITVFITGMALGIDLWSARIIMNLRRTEKYQHIKLVGAIPISNQSKIWRLEGREEWNKVFNALDEFHLVHEIPEYKIPSRMELNEETGLEERVYATIGEKMQRRNEFMVDYSSRGIVVYTGKPGGTQNCALYAVQQGLGNEITLLSPTSLKVQEGIV